jgi:hypothetical protein
MLMRATIIATLLAGAAMSATAQPADPIPAPCGDEMNLRVYFAPGSSTLDPVATEMIDAAERQMAQCDYIELHVMVTPTALSRSRGQAILAAADRQVWDVARVDPMPLNHRVAAHAPDYIEVAMTTYVMPAEQLEDLQEPPAVGI